MSTREGSRILLIEDTVSLALAFRTQLVNAGYRVDTATLGSQARTSIKQHEYSLIMLDLHLPDVDGLALLEEIKIQHIDALIIVVTADGTAERVVNAMRLGAHDYLVKPIAPERLVLTVRNALQLVELKERVRSTGGRSEFYGFIGASKTMQAVYNAIENVAQSKATVFITGESGTGKEVCAEALHRQSARRDQPFVAVNCGAIPSELIESELYGHVKGAFTGAVANRDGAATMANGGTLFLDEICEMDVSLQAKLLRFLQTNFIQRVGSQKTEAVDLRVICATNRDPLEEVRTGRFREDLYYRLNVIPILLPPLRERENDALLVASELLTRISAEEGKTFDRISPEVESILLKYPWPGNVRELQNLIRRIVVMNDADTVTIDMLPASLTAPHSIEPVKTEGMPVGQVAQDEDTGLYAKVDVENSWTSDQTLMEIERKAIESRLAHHQGNVVEAASTLGVNPSTIYRKMADWAKNPLIDTK